MSFLVASKATLRTMSLAPESSCCEAGCATAAPRLPARPWEGRRMLSCSISLWPSSNVPCTHTATVSLRPSNLLAASATLPARPRGSPLALLQQALAGLGQKQGQQHASGMPTIQTLTRPARAVGRSRYWQAPQSARVRRLTQG